jgi:AraC family transcriptional regulator
MTCSGRAERMPVNKEREPRLPVGAFYGERLGSREVAGFLLTDYAYPPGFRIPRHSHERAYFSLVLEGAYTETYGRRTRECRASTVVFHPASEAHAEQIHGARGRTFSVELAPRWVERVREYPTVVDTPAAFEGGELLWLASRLYREFLLEDAVSPLAVEGLALEILAEASRRRAHVLERSPPRWLREARELLQERFTESLSLDDVAEAVGVHPAHLARVFRQQYRCTVGDYVRQRRIDFACRALATSDIPLGEIAIAAGFSDQSHFSRIFKRLMGLTPGEFRRISRACK